MNFKSILIVTYGRSGSTLLQGLLNSIDGCVVRGENFNICYGLFLAYSSLMKSIKEQSFPGRSVTNPFFGAHLLEEEKFISDARDLLKNQLLPEKELQGTCFGFKEIRYLRKDLDNGYSFDQYMTFLNKLLPRVAFVFLTRKHDDVAQSGWWKSVNPDRLLNDLTLFEDSARKFSQGRDNCFWIAYEEIINSSRNLFELFDFLGANYDMGRIEQVLATKHSVDVKSASLAVHSNVGHYSVTVKPRSIIENLIAKAEIDHFPSTVEIGKPFDFGGLVVLGKEIIGQSRLRVVSAGEERQVRWGIESPWIKKTYPDSPNCTAARFRANDVLIESDNPVEVFLDDALGGRHLLWELHFSPLIDKDL